MTIRVLFVLLSSFLTAAERDSFPDPPEAAVELITVAPGTWRSASVFTHVIWNDLLFFGASAGKDGGDPRHEMEIGVYNLKESVFHPQNPIITRDQFGLRKPGRGITPLCILEVGERLFMFCTARPERDLQPRIVMIEARKNDPFAWSNLTVIVDSKLSGEINNHGASALINPQNPKEVLLYFSALTPPAEYRILLASAPLDDIRNPAAWKLLNNYADPVLQREHAKANYPFVRFDPTSRRYELWYSGQSEKNPRKRAIFVTRSDRHDQFLPARQAIIEPSDDETRNDHAYATGPKLYDGNLYYSGRMEAKGDYRAIFRTPIPPQPKK